VKMVWDLTQQVIRGRNKTIELVEESPEKSKSSDKKEKKTTQRVEINWTEISCPKCKVQKLIKGKTAIGCSDFNQCGFKIPFEVFGKKLTEKQLMDLVAKAKTSKLKGFKSHPDGLTEGILTLTADFEVELS